MPRYLDPAKAKANMINKGVWPISPWPGSGQRWLCACMECGDFVKPRHGNVMQPGRGGCNEAGGVSVKELAEYLGHADPGFTLRVYAHMMPGSHDRARQAIDNRLFKPRTTGIEPRELG